MATADYNKLKLELARRLRVYWDSCGLIGRIGEFWQEEKLPDEEWIQCDNCLKVRAILIILYLRTNSISVATSQQGECFTERGGVIHLFNVGFETNR